MVLTVDMMPMVASFGVSLMTRPVKVAWAGCGDTYSSLLVGSGLQTTFTLHTHHAGSSNKRSELLGGLQTFAEVLVGPAGPAVLLQDSWLAQNLCCKSRHAQLCRATPRSHRQGNQLLMQPQPLHATNSCLQHNQDPVS